MRKGLSGPLPEGLITDADRDYRRVVEAELASEALAELEVLPYLTRQKAARIAADCASVAERI